ncbi:MAG: tetratricopeptide repeat protein [Anaerolineae bacterium]|nr:tetratricopeptide repeat protein [Anaerolineae bacterium]
MPGDKELFQQSMNNGHSEAWDQRWDKAAQFYMTALKEFPQNPKALTSLGLALFETQNFDEALKYYQAASKVQPEDPLPVEKIAEILERTGKIKESATFSIRAADLYLNTKDAEKAIQNWTRVTRLMPDHLAAHSRLALVHERLGRKRQAITEYIAVASLLQHTGKLQEALQTVTHALTLDSNSVEAQQALDMIKANKSLPKPVRLPGATGPLRMAQVRDMEIKKQQVAAASQQDGPDPITEARQNALTALAGMLFDVPDNGEEVSPQRVNITTSLMSPGPDRSKVSRHLSSAIDFQSRGKRKDAAKELKKVISAGLDDPAVHFNLGLVQYQSGEKSKAQPSLQRSVTNPVYALAARLMLGEHYLESQRIIEAAGEYLEALKAADAAVVDPQRSDELRQQYEPIIESYNQNDDEEALQELCDNIAALLMRPGWRAHLTEARKQLPKPGAYAPPVPLADILLQSEGSHVVEVMSRINQLARAGHLRTAMEEAYIVLDHVPTYLPLHISMAELLLRNENTQSAITKFNMVAKAYSSRGEASRARDLYRRIIQLSPMDLAARTRLIDQLISQGETDIALAELVELADVYYRLAELERARSTYERALRMAQQSRVERKWNLKILHHMADIDLQRLDWRKALRVYEQLRSLDPDDQKTRINLIGLNVRLGQEDLSIAELDNYLSYLAGNAKESESIAFIEKLIEEYPNRIFPRQRLAAKYQQASRTEDAIEQWDKVAEMMYDAKNIEGAKEALRAILLINPPTADKYRAFLTKLEAESS